MWQVIWYLVFSVLQLPDPSKETSINICSWKSFVDDKIWSNERQKKKKKQVIFLVVAQQDNI